MTTGVHPDLIAAVGEATLGRWLAASACNGAAGTTDAVST